MNDRGATINFCFCTLALGSKYRLMTKQLAEDLANYCPSSVIVVGTDAIDEFKNCPNIVAFEHQQKSILHCYNDKRFILERALLEFPSAIYIDADTRIIETIPDNLEFLPGITGLFKNALNHITQYRPQDLAKIKDVADKLNISIDKVHWIGESLFVVTRDEGKEKEFLQMWGKITSYLELKGMHSGEGSVMGLAATKVGLNVTKTDSWETLNKLTQHLDASTQRSKRTFWQNLQRRLGYHYRMTKARLAALKDFDFYYR